MAEKVPIKAVYDGSDTCGLAELQNGEVVGVEHGGLGACTFTTDGVLLGNTQSAVQVSSALTTNGQLLIGGTSGPAVANITGTANEVEITNADQSITIGLPATVSGLTCVGATCLGGTLQTAAQANVTSVGTLGSLVISGDLTVDTTTLAIDSTNNRVGIGTATPSHLVDIEGVGHAVTCFVSADLCATTKIVGAAICMGGAYALPTSDGTAGYILCTDGSGAISFADAKGRTIAEDGSPLADRSCLNFCGAAVTLTDCSATDSTDVQIRATGACLPVRVTDGTQCYPCLVNATIAAPCLQCDTAPKLGGNLDVNGNSIISASNGNIPITPNGSGIVILDGICHPIADGSAGQVLCTDGSAALQFATLASTSPGGSDTYVQFNDGGSFGGSANLTWDDTTFKGSNFCTAGTATLATVDINAGAIDGTTIGAASAAAITGTTITGSGNISFDGGTFVFNESGADKDFRIEGDTAANLFITDASTDRIGIGTATPSHLLDVDGVAHVATCLITPKICITSQYVLPAADGSAGQIVCTDGSGTTQFADAASSGHTIAEDGSALTSRTCLNFVGSAVTATDNSGTDATDVTVCATSSLLGVRAADGTACCITLSSAAVGESLVSDTSPQLGGDLDVNGNSIVSDASNENIPITPHGTGSVVISKLSVTGDTSLDGGTFVFNESGADKDFRIEGDTAANLFIADASTDRIGIGTATPSHLVDIEGVAHAATCFVSADLCATTKVVSPAFCIGSQYVLPTADGSAGQIMCTDGSGALAFATVSAGVTLAGSTNNTIATVTGSNALAGEANLTFDGTALGIGTDSPAGLFEIAGANAYAYFDATQHVFLQLDRGSTSYHSSIQFTTAGTTNWRLTQMGADNLLSVYDQNAEANVMTWLQGGNIGIGTDTAAGKLHILQPTDADIGLRIAQDDNSGAPPTSAPIWIEGTNEAGTTQYFTLGNSGLWVSSRLWVNDDVNAFMSLGATINQGAYDNEILSLKSTDVTHGMTGITDTDTYGFFKKFDADNGGLWIRSLMDTASEYSLRLDATAGAVDTAKSGGARAPIYMKSNLKSGTSQTTVSADGNIVVFNNGATVRFIFDTEGSGHADVEWTTFDKHDDIALLHDIEATMVPDTFGAAMKYDAAALTKAGILGKDSLHSEKEGTTRGMINFTKLSMLHHGAIRQVHQQLQDVKEFYQDKIAALESRLMRLEA